MRLTGAFEAPDIPSRTHDELASALDRLMSLADGDRGVIDVVACGPRAISELRTLLFQREPSGLYQPRCRVVEALSKLGARDVLIAILDTDRDISDPVERAGEDAVLNAAARSLRGITDEAIFRRLLWLAETRRLAGAIEALGSFRRPEALPCLIAALANDLARPAAEDAIRQFGHDAMPALLDGASAHGSPNDTESESARRRRRASLSLLLEICGPAWIPAQQRADWINDNDPAIALLGCRLALAEGDSEARRAIVQRLIAMLPAVHWRIRHSIEDCLVDYGEAARPVVRAAIPAVAPSEEDHSAYADAQRHLLWLAHRLRI